MRVAAVSMNGLLGDPERGRGGPKQANHLGIEALARVSLK
jgi:hypothetical protein